MFHRDRTDVINDDMIVNLRENDISFNRFDRLRSEETYYWSLPRVSNVGEILKNFIWIILIQT